MRQFFCVVLLLISFHVAFSQTIGGEVIAGMNVAQVDGDEVVGYRKVGLNAGVGAILNIKNSWYVSIETLFSQKGAFKKYPPSSDTDYPYYDLRLNYAEVPLLFHYNDKNKMIFGVGASYGRLVSIKEIEHGQEINWQTSRGPYSNDDFNVLLDIRIPIYKSLLFDFRYAYSLSKIRTRTFTTATETWTRDQYNNLVTFRLMFVFGGKNKNE